MKSKNSLASTYDPLVSLECHAVTCMKPNLLALSKSFALKYHPRILNQVSRAVFSRRTRGLPEVLEFYGASAGLWSLLLFKISDSRKRKKKIQ
jgi:hypothetical protein